MTKTSTLIRVHGGAGAARGVFSLLNLHRLCWPRGPGPLTSQSTSSLWAGGTSSTFCFFHLWAISRILSEGALAASSGKV